MNANELADELEEGGEIGAMDAIEIADLLRTIPVLEAEIEALKGKAEQSYDEGFKRGVQQTALNGQARGC